MADIAEAVLFVLRADVDIVADKFLSYSITVC